MNPELGLAGFAALLGLIALRVPIGIALILVSFTGIYLLVGWVPALGSLRIIPLEFASSWELSSVPMFLLMGFLAYHTGITGGLFKAARVWLVRLPGGLAIASIFGSAGFAAVTGSSVACAAAMGRIAVPEMIKHGYSKGLATGCVAAAGTIGALIPPSILFILYGIIAQVPIAKLFSGGVGAGLLTAAGYITVILIWTTLNKSAAPKSAETHSWAERLYLLKEIVPVIVLAGLVFGGLFFGVFTPAEAGAVGTVITILIAIARRTMSVRAFKDSVVESFSTTSALLLIAIGANMLSRFVSLSGVDGYIADLVVAFSDNRYVFMLTVTVIYLILGMFLEPIGAMLITLPILLPVANTLGIDEILFGVLIAKLLEVGMITPPIGLNVFVIKGVVGRSIPLGTIFRGVSWFLFSDLLVIAAIILFPAIVLFLPSLVQ